MNIEYLDRGYGTIEVQYDVAGEPTERQPTPYRLAPSPAAILQNSGKIRSHWLRLPSARLERRQNFNSDFRFRGTGEMFVSAIHLSHGKPLIPAAAPYVPDEPMKPLPPDFELILGLGTVPMHADDLPSRNARIRRTIPLLKQTGITSFETYVVWTQVESKPGEFDWSFYDEEVNLLRERNLKWVPFLIAGPAHSLPEWYRQSPNSVPFVCLEHYEPSGIESIWNPALHDRVRRFLEEFKAHYGEGDWIESLLLGPSGRFGESIYPTGGDDWTALLPGPYHSHRGHWMGDQYAIENFRHFLERKYGDVEALSNSWGKPFEDFDEIFPLQGKAGDLSDTAYLDTILWYSEAMTEYCRFWLETAREIYPTKKIYLCAGGVGEPILGANFSRLAKLASEYGAGIRLTNETTDYDLNFAHTRWMTTACRFYGCDLTLEPSGVVQPEGHVSRIYNAVTSGANGIYDYVPNRLISQVSATALMEHSDLLHKGNRKVDVAAFLSRTSWVIDRANPIPTFIDLRDYLDFDIVDETLIVDGILERYRILMLFEGASYEQDVIDKIREWVEKGGVLISFNTGPVMREIGSGKEVDDLFQDVPEKSVRGVVQIAPSLLAKGTAIDLGSGKDGWFLSGDGWRNGQTVKGRKEGDISLRWTRGDALIHAYTDPDRDAKLIIHTYLPASKPEADFKDAWAAVHVNGIPIGKVQGKGRHEFHLPKEMLDGYSQVLIRFEGPTWKLFDLGNTDDSRTVGIAVQSLKLYPADASEPVECRKPKFKVNIPLLVQKCSRTYGQGVTIRWPQSPAGVLAPILEHLEEFGSTAGSVDLIDGEKDGIYASTLIERDGTTVHYFLNQSRAKKKIKRGGTVHFLPSLSITTIPD